MMKGLHMAPHGALNIANSILGISAHKLKIAEKSDIEKPLSLVGQITEAIQGKHSLNKDMHDWEDAISGHFNPQGPFAVNQYQHHQGQPAPHNQYPQGQPGGGLQAGVVPAQPGLVGQPQQPMNLPGAAQHPSQQAAQNAFLANIHQHLPLPPLNPNAQNMD